MKYNWIEHNIVYIYNNYEYDITGLLTHIELLGPLGPLGLSKGRGAVDKEQKHRTVRVGSPGATRRTSAPKKGHQLCPGIEDTGLNMLNM